MISVRSALNSVEVEMQLYCLRLQKVAIRALSDSLHAVLSSSNLVEGSHMFQQGFISRQINPSFGKRCLGPIPVFLLSSSIFQLLNRQMWLNVDKYYL